MARSQRLREQCCGLSARLSRCRERPEVTPPVSPYMSLPKTAPGRTCHRARSDDARLHSWCSDAHLSPDGISERTASTWVFMTRGFGWFRTSTIRLSRSGASTTSATTSTSSHCSSYPPTGWAPARTFSMRSRRCGSGWRHSYLAFGTGPVGARGCLSGRSAAYLLYPALEWINQWQFHPDAGHHHPADVAAYWLATRRRWGWSTSGLQSPSPFRVRKSMQVWPSLGPRRLSLAQTSSAGAGCSPR